MHSSWPSGHSALRRACPLLFPECVCGRGLENWVAEASTASLSEGLSLGNTQCQGQGGVPGVSSPSLEA